MELGFAPRSRTSESLWWRVLYLRVWPQASLTPFSLSLSARFPRSVLFLPPAVPRFPPSLRPSPHPQRSTQPPRWLPLARRCPSHPRSSSSSSREKVRVREHYYFIHFTHLALCNRHTKEVGGELMRSPHSGATHVWRMWKLPLYTSLSP